MQLGKRFSLAGVPYDGCLSIVCSYGGEHYIHNIQIGCHGMVEGNLYDQLPKGHKILGVNETAPQVRLIWSTASPPLDCFGTRSLFVMEKPWGSDSFNQLVELNTQSLAKNLNWIPPKVSTCSFFIATSARIYVVAVPPIAIECLSTSNMDEDLEWKSIPLPDCFHSDSLIEISGYVVVEELCLILFCIAFRKKFEFYALDTRAHQWFNISIKTSDYIRYEPPYFPCNLPFFDVYNIYPFYGRAEYVDGLLYGCLGRDLVTYCFTGTEDGTFLLQPSGVFYLSKHASAFKKAPFGVPSYHSRCITHMQNGIFCLVETAQEPSGKTFIQPVYITTFESFMNTNNFDEPEGRIRVLDSTIRFIDVKDTYLSETDTKIICCYSWLPPESAGKRQRMMQGPCTPLPFDFERYIHEKIPCFCEALLLSFSQLSSYANMLFFNIRHGLENFQNPFVKFFVGLMECKVNGGPPPDPFLLVDKSLDVGGVICDGVELLDCSRSVFMVSTFGPSCDIYELKISEYGFVCGGLISKGIGVKEEEDTGAAFGYLTSSSTGHTVCLLSANLNTNTFANCYVVNMIQKEVVKVPVKGDPQVETKLFTVIGYRKKFYVLSNPIFIHDTPEPPFRCFDPVSHMWQTLKDAPFHSGDSDSDVAGYAFVEDHILISLGYPGIMFYSYNICKGEWAEVLLCKNNEEDAGEYHCFNGKAEYVNGRIYAYNQRTVFRFDVEKSGDALKLCPPSILNGLDIVYPPVNWDGTVFESMTYIGGGLFFLVETSSCPLLVDYQYACLTTFSINEHLDVQTHHSTVSVIDSKGSSVYISYCFSDYDFERGHVDHF